MEIGMTETLEGRKTGEELNQLTMNQAIAYAAEHGLGLLSIADPSGDFRMTWDKSNGDEVALARKAFDQASENRMLAYSVDPANSGKGERVREFDPDAQALIMHRQLQGG